MAWHWKSACVRYIFLFYIIQDGKDTKDSKDIKDIKTGNTERQNGPVVVKASKDKKKINQKVGAKPIAAIFIQLTPHSLEPSVYFKLNGRNNLLSKWKFTR